jgi:hypothetical protein
MKDLIYCKILLQPKFDIVTDLINAWLGDGAENT